MTDLLQVTKFLFNVNNYLTYIWYLVYDVSGVGSNDQLLLGLWSCQQIWQSLIISILFSIVSIICLSDTQDKASFTAVIGDWLSLSFFKACYVHLLYQYWVGYYPLSYI
jgi:hypothetical protein